MKSDKSSLKKAVKKVTQSIRKGGAAVAARLKKAGQAPDAKSEETTAEQMAATPAKTAALKAKKKAPAKKAELPVPAILLEGDQSPAPAVSGPGVRYALGPVPPAKATGLESQGEL